MTTAPPVSREEKRARWCREVRVITVATEDHALPVPRIDERRAIFVICGEDAAARLTAAEAALGEALSVTFTARTATLGASETEWYILDAELPSGMVLSIEALAREVAEKRVTGRKFTEITEWVRVPAAAVPAGSGAAA